ncbi:hypothetical protein E2C01_022531 [Portunus trituberculatus]|uniref:Uncharacterized protein n=1 Tax=Portunus trituberculatus TaxID=210409 RepID=A0A5B7E7I9_PORTR|nr:hypothetical protein [Portunus trituberculatus]
MDSKAKGSITALHHHCNGAGNASPAVGFHPRCLHTRLVRIGRTVNTYVHIHAGLPLPPTKTAMFD